MALQVFYEKTIRQKNDKYLLLLLSPTHKPAAEGRQEAFHRVNADDDDRSTTAKRSVLF